MKRNYQSTLQRRPRSGLGLAISSLAFAAFSLGFSTSALVGNLGNPRPVEDTSLLWRQPKEGKNLPPAPVLPATGNPNTL